VLPLCLSLLLAPQGPTSATELLSLAHLVASPHPEPAPWGSLLVAADGEYLLDTGDGEDDLPPLLEELLIAHRAAVDGNQLRLALRGTLLTANGAANDVIRVKEHVRQLTGVLARPLQIECAVWDATDRETPAAQLGPNDVARVFADLTPLARGIATTKPGGTAALERMRWTRYVRCLESEVAQKQSATRPATASFGEGLHAIVHAHPLVGSDEFAVHVQFVAGLRRGPVRTMQTGLVGAADLELPLLETDYGTFSGRIANGGCLVATLRGHASTGGQRMVSVRVSGAAAPKPTFEELGVYPCGALTSRALLAVPQREDGAAVADGHGILTPDDLVELLQAHLDGAGTVACHHGHLFVRAPTAVQTKVETALRTLQDRLVRAATVRHLAALQPTDRAGGNTVAAMHELAAPTLLGRQLTLARCLETNAITDVWIAIAQEASQLTPAAERFHSGTWLTLRASPIDDTLSLRLTSDDRHGVVPSGRSVMPGAVLMQPDVARCVTHHDGAVGNGQRIDHGDGPAVVLDGRAYRSSLTTELRW
jgi:hypothetical protein